VLRKGAHDKRLYTSELTQTALDGAGAHLLAIWPADSRHERPGSSCLTGPRIPAGQMQYLVLTSVQAPGEGRQCF
jgi:hypothetical protein